MAKSKSSQNNKRPVKKKDSINTSPFPKQKWKLQESSLRFDEKGGLSNRRTILEGVDAVNKDLPIFQQLDEISVAIKCEIAARNTYIYTRRYEPTENQKILMLSILNDRERELIFQSDLTGIFRKTKDFFDNASFSNDEHIKLNATKKDKERLNHYEGFIISRSEVEYLILFDEYLDNLNPHEQSQVNPTLEPEYYDDVRNAKRIYKGLKPVEPTFAE